MQIGVCASASSIKGLQGHGLDFLEGNVQSFLVPLSPDDEFEKNLQEARSLEVPVKAANCFLPGDMKCVGLSVDIEAVLSYADTAFKRAQRAGIDTIVFGSGDSRAVPEGFSKGEAVEQFTSLLKQIGPLAEARKVVVTIEPLNSKECNFINSLSEGAEIVIRADHPNIALLADFFHMARDGQTADDILKFGKLLQHVHVAEKDERTAPGVAGDDFRPYLKALKDVGYKGRISLECRWSDIRKQVGGSVRELRRQIREA